MEQHTYEVSVSVLFGSSVTFTETPSHTHTSAHASYIIHTPKHTLPHTQAPVCQTHHLSKRAGLHTD